MKTTRRGLFGLLLGAAGVAALPKVAEPKTTGSLVVEGGVWPNKEIAWGMNQRTGEIIRVTGFGSSKLEFERGPFNEVD